MLIIYGLFFSEEASRYEWHVSGVTKFLSQFLLVVMFGSSLVAGLYYTLFVVTVVLDIHHGSVTRLTCAFGKIVHRKVWGLSEFTRIELRHRRAGSDTDTFQSDVGLRHRSGVIVWLRAFHVESESPSPEAQAFANELSANIWNR